MRNSFVHGALVLMIAAAFNRVIGFIYQAAIYRLIGAEGMGLFNIVYPVYILIIVIATAGIPLGISKLVSEEEVKGNRRGSYQILWLSLSILIISGVFFTALSYLISPLLAKYIFVNKMAYPIFLCLLPGLLVISVSSALRGFFQGQMNMKPPALAQVFEQIFRVVAGFFLASFLLPMGIQWAVVGIAAASIFGELIGLTVMLVTFFRDKPTNFGIELPSLKMSGLILHNLLDLCTPITLGRIAATFMLTVDSMLIPLMLKKVGLSTQMATVIYGQITTVALTLLMVPSIITVSLATSLVPAISEAVALNRPLVVSSRTSTAIRVTILSGVPFIAAYMVLADPITQAIFGSAQSGRLLSILALGGIFVYLQQTTTGILQGLGFPDIPLKNMIIGGATKILAICTLTFMPGFCVEQIIYSYNIFFIITAVLNLHALYQKTTYSLSFGNDLLKPCLTGVCTAWLLSETYKMVLPITNNAVGVIVSLSVGFIIYLALIIFIGSLKSSDLQKIPVLRKMVGRRR